MGLKTALHLYLKPTEIHEDDYFQNIPHCKTHPCNENRVFPVKFFSQGKTCFYYRDGFAVHTKRIHLFCNYKNWCKMSDSNSNFTENMGPCLKLIPTKYVTVKRVKREAYCHNGAKKLHRVASKFS